MSITMKCLVILAALGFLAGSASGDNPKTYRISISTDSQIGDEQFQAGEYKLVVDTHDPKVRFTEVSTGNEIELEAKVVTVEEKFDKTAIHSDRSSGMSRIVEIRLGGSKTRVVFE